MPSRCYTAQNTNNNPNHHIDLFKKFIILFINLLINLHVEFVSYKWNCEGFSTKPHATQKQPAIILITGIVNPIINSSTCHIGIGTLSLYFGFCFDIGTSLKDLETVWYKQDLKLNPII